MRRLSPRRWQHAALGKRFFVALVLCSALQANSATATPALAQAARQQIGVTLIYDGRYQRLEYPNGDVPTERGVCTDVVIRAFRELGIDLQRRIHEDMQQAWQSYPKLWGLTRPDRNIDHRRVPNMAHYFQRQGWKLIAGAEYLPGDLVTWMLPGNLPHIGIVSDKKMGDRPLIIHNIGAGVVEEDMILRFPVTGHFRPVVVVDSSAD